MLERYGQCGYFHDKGVYWSMVKITFDYVGWNNIRENLKMEGCSFGLVL